MCRPDSCYDDGYVFREMSTMPIFFGPALGRERMGRVIPLLALRLWLAADAAGIHAPHRPPARREPPVGEPARPKRVRRKDVRSCRSSLVRGGRHARRARRVIVG